MSICRNTRLRVSESLDGGAPVPASAARHLEVCPECASFRDGARALGAQLSRRVEVPDGGAPDGMHDRIMAAVRADGGAAEAAPAPARVVGWRFLGGISAAAAAIALAFLAPRGGEPEPAGGEVVELAPGGPGLPSGFEVPVDVAGVTASVGRRFSGAFSREAEAIASDLDKIRDYFGSRLLGAVGRGS